MSEIDPNKLKVVELRAELSTRGLDTKGNKAVLIRRLRTALNAERGDNGDGEEDNAATGNDSVMDTSQDSQGDGNDTEPDEKQVETPKVEVKLVRMETPVKVAAAATTPKTPDPGSAGKPKSSASPKEKDKEKEKDKAVKEKEPKEQKEKAEKEDAEPMDVDKVMVKDEPVEEKEVKEEKEEKADVPQGTEEKDVGEDAVKREPEECTEDDAKEKDAPVLANGDAAIEGQASVTNPKDESEPVSDEVKKDEVPEMVGQPITTMTSSSYGDRRRRSRSQSPFRRRRSHSRERRRSRSKSPQRAAVVEEEDDAFDMTLVTLDYYNSDLNLVLSKTRYGGSPLTDEGFAYMWAGARATYGFTKGKVHFEIKVVKHLDVNLPKDEPNPQVVRVGWSTDDTSLQLGEEAFSYGYGGTGKKSTDCQFTDYGDGFAEGDCVGCFLDLEKDPVEMIFAKNGESLGVAFTVKKEELGEKALFPHVLTKNCSFEVNFGQLEEPFNQLPIGDDFENYVFAHNVPAEDRIRGSVPPAKREECEMIMMCGLPGAGKTTWAAEFVSKNPEKKYNVLGTNNIIDKMRLMGLPRKRNYSGRWDVLIERSTKCLNKMMEMGAKRRRNYILDQTNVYASAQRRKMRPFDGFKRRAVVIVPSDEELKKRIAKREKEEGKDVPDSAVLEMKANFILPEVGPLFESVEYAELSETDTKPLIEQYNKEGRAAFPPSSKRPRFDDRSGFHGSPRVVSSRDRDRDRDRGWNDRRSMGPRSYGGGPGSGWGSGMSMRGSGSRGQQSYRGSSGRGGMGHSSMRSGGGGGYMNRSGGGGGGYGGGGGQYHNQGGWGGSGYHHQPQHHQHHGHHQPQHHKPYQSRPNSQYQKPQSMSTSHSGYGQNYDYYNQQPSYSQQSYSQQWKPSAAAAPYGQVQAAASYPAYSGGYSSAVVPSSAAHYQPHSAASSQVPQQSYGPQYYGQQWSQAGQQPAQSTSSSYYSSQNYSQQYYDQYYAAQQGQQYSSYSQPK